MRAFAAERRADQTAVIMQPLDADRISNFPDARTTNFSALDPLRL
jgi:hypothetical protein